MQIFLLIINKLPTVASRNPQPKAGGRQRGADAVPSGPFLAVNKALVSGKAWENHHQIQLMGAAAPKSKRFYQTKPPFVQMSPGSMSHHFHIIAT
jgi:hypothetical protein